MKKFSKSEIQSKKASHAEPNLSNSKLVTVCGEWSVKANPMNYGLTVVTADYSSAVALRDALTRVLEGEV